jgi:type III restriction enzyme
MSGLELKEYQRESLEAIERFCDAVRTAIGNRALRPVHDAYFLATGRDFVDLPQLPGVPYVCLRVPTGGGKTLIAAHAVGVMAKHLGHQDRPLCLWVTPSTTIRDQTLRGLRDREHPYHAALREGLGRAPVEVLTMEEALSASGATLSSSAAVVVTTIQSYRIRNDRGELEEATRKVYEDNGSLMDHFTNLDERSRMMVSDPVSGAINWSLANVFRLRGPIVIMDEAHNARTRISFDSLERFGPLAVLELTATPQQHHDPARGEYASNVLHAVSALQVHAEAMIKLPVELESRADWLDVLAAAKQTRDALERRAAEWGQRSGRRVRPVALLQAQPRRQDRETHTVEAVKAALVDRLRVPAERIRIATGKNDDLGDEDLTAPGCIIEYVITVDKLREGWDCPFAYVLGSVGNVATDTAVEQLLGRVLRMPQATPTGVAELDRAYAIVQSPDVLDTARDLCDGLVKCCGFDADTVQDAFRVHRHSDPQGRLALTTIPLSAPPDAERLTAAIRARVRYDAVSGTLQVTEGLSHDEALALHEAVQSPADRAAVERYWEAEREVGTAPRVLGQYAPPLRVPQLVVRDGERSYLFEPEELDEFAWNLDQCDPAIGETEFNVAMDVGGHVTLGVAERGGVQIGGVERVIQRQLAFAGDDDNWSKAELVRWLDNELHRGGRFMGLLQSESQAWLNRAADYLLSERHADLPILVRKRHDLANVIIPRIAEHGRQQVRLAANTLIDGRSPRRLETSMDVASVLEEQRYGPYRQYVGRYNFHPKHAFDLIGEMGDEESECAKRINDHPSVKRWVRNLTHESAGGFSLPLSPGRFFPDFIAELNDGRLAIVEYKNPVLNQVMEERHKKAVGELWAERSGGRCAFMWVVDRDWARLEAALNAITTS